MHFVHRIQGAPRSVVISSSARVVGHLLVLMNEYCNIDQMLSLESKLMGWLVTLARENSRLYVLIISLKML